MTEPTSTHDWSLSDFQSLAIAAASQAGELLLDRPTHLDVQGKSTPTDAVTQMDRASEAFLVEFLTAARPNDAILGEEGASREGSTPYRWVIDPIDGTVNYLYDLPMWSVSVGLCRDGEPIVGAVAAPAMGTLFYGMLGGGSFEHRDGQLPQQLSVRGETQLSMALVATGFMYSATARGQQATIAASLLPQVRDIRRMGSAAFDMCTLAAGRVDGYYERGLNAWDYTGAAVIAREAGAVVGGIESDQPTSEMTIAANPQLYPQLCEAIVAAGATGRASS